MIAKCLALLAVVAQISASVCNEVVIPSCGSAVSGSQLVLGSSGVSGISGISGLLGGFSTGSGAAVKNVVANGRFPVALSSCGPNPDSRVPITTSAVSAPLQEKPTIRVPCNIPAPRCISHTCTCYKTIVKPRVHQQVITVPSVQRYVQTTHKPVVENIQYEALPVNCCADTGISGSSVQLLGVSSAPQVQAISVPQVQTVAIPHVQTVTVPQVQAIEIPQTVSLGSSCAC